VSIVVDRWKVRPLTTNFPELNSTVAKIAEGTRMKKETTLDKLNAILGIKAAAEELKVKSSGKTVGISEDEIQTWREIQGLIYFLQAPALFQPRVCKNCNTKFVVSRLYVAFCSYLCIKEDLRNKGIEWTRDSNIEELVLSKHVYEGNEPLWVKEPTLSKLREMLDELFKMEIPSSVTQTSPLEPTGPVLQTPPETSTSSVPSPITPPTETMKKSSNGKSAKRISISFG
jgi:hypothetical protein